MPADLPHARRPPGLVLFLTGPSSDDTAALARALEARVRRQDPRTTTGLDGDEVRQHLSPGPTDSDADRETHLRRLGWVAAEIARHGGVAVLSPVAPLEATRRQVRALVEDAGGAFVLVHVGRTSSVGPADADVRVDPTDRTVDDALADVVEALAAAGHVDLRGSVPAERVGARREPGPGPRPLDVLFVCTANICRSPYMELAARQVAGPGVRFTSAGTHGWVDHAVSPEMARPLAERGVDPSGFRSRRLTRQMVEDADLVLTAEASHRSFILDDSPAAFRKVVTLGQAGRAIGSLPGDLSPAEVLGALAEHRGPADPALDVADPYGRDAAAADRAAERIDALLRVVLPALTR
ncbi:adenylyl-sulfate kinase [Nocardioides sp. 1609]|uniref:adenylyl-sulfate kinase n=1 Tax=Nocardioides sp. 1609 TaxID=2508327 RepID=UPI001FD66934|nr:adenylyl-sulfate kinase [Nocardioides sp. 1609]